MTRHTDAEIEEAAKRYQDLTDGLDVATATVEDIPDLREVADVAQTVREDEARLRAVVERARAQGRSWNEIAVALGVTRQAARQRFSNKTPV